MALKCRNRCLPLTVQDFYDDLMVRGQEFISQHLRPYAYSPIVTRGGRPRPGVPSQGNELPCLLPEADRRTSGPELQALRRRPRDEPETADVFVSERKAPLTTDAMRKIVSRAGRQAVIAFPVHPTCCATPPATSWRTMGRTPGPFSCIWATATSSTPRGTRNWSPTASRISGKTD